MDTRYLYGSGAVLSPAPHARYSLLMWRRRVAENRTLAGQCSCVVNAFPHCASFSHITFDKPSYRITQSNA